MTKKNKRGTLLAHVFLSTFLSLLTAITIMTMTIIEETSHREKFLETFGASQLLWVQSAAKNAEILLNAGESEDTALEIILNQAETSGSRHWFFYTKNTILFETDAEITAKLKNKTPWQMIDEWKISGGENISAFENQLKNKQNGVCIFSEAIEENKKIVSWQSFSVDETRYYLGVSTDQNYVFSISGFSLHSLRIYIAMGTITLCFLLFSLYYCLHLIFFRRGMNQSSETLEQKNQRLESMVNLLDDERKNTETASTRDALTMVYNRKFFDVILEKLDHSSKPFLPASVIILDINGLKTVNETNGFSYGDGLLEQTAQIAKDYCNESDLLARTNNSEFTLFLANTPLKEALSTAQKIKTQLIFPKNVALSFGAAEKTEESERMQTVLQTAQHQLNLEKYLTAPSARYDIIRLLLNSLMERTNETETHCQRMAHLAVEIGKVLSLDRTSLLKLELGALLHDIGKIGIPDNILRKNSALTPDEQKIMRQHPEIGCRIAQAMPDMYDISLLILQHHEKYDGSGYPNGLNWEQTDLLARILTVADSYDAMTSDRVYSQARSTKFGLFELTRFSGTQFDPNIVDAFIEISKNQDFKF